MRRLTVLRLTVLRWNVRLLESAGLDTDTQKDRHTMYLGTHTHASFYLTVRRAACRKLTQALALLGAVLVVLLVLWCAAGTAHAAIYEEHCTRGPLHNGRVGETVVTCDLRRVQTVVRPTTRLPGRTTVVHYGARATRVASR